MITLKTAIGSRKSTQALDAPTAIQKRLFVGKVITPLLTSLLLFSPSAVFAHEDLDIGIAAVSLDKTCHVNITLQNAGPNLSESFYLTVNPGFITITKGEQREEFASLRKLDRKRVLLPAGGTLELRSKKIYAGNPHHLRIEFHAQGEFFDYEAENNVLLASMDCHPGEGQIAGAPIIYTQPDVAIGQVKIDPKTCAITANLFNTTAVAMPDSAWSKEEGVSLEQFDVDRSEHIATQALQDFDPNRQFTRSKQAWRWSSPLPATSAKRWRLAVWRVPEDLNFKNNTVEIDIPEECRRLAD